MSTHTSQGTQGTPEAGATGSQIAASLNDEMLPWQSPDLTNFNNAIAAMFNQVEELAYDTDDGAGWTILFDVDRCPLYALPFLAQIIGLRLPLGISEDDARALLRSHPNWRRGTPRAILDAAQSKLTGFGPPLLVERDGVSGDDPYRLTVVINATDTTVPVGTYSRTSPDPAGIYAAIKAVMNPGILNLIVTSTWLISGMEAAGYASIAALEAAFSSIGKLETHA